MQDTYDFLFKCIIYIIKFPAIYNIIILSIDNNSRILLGLNGTVADMPTDVKLHYRKARRNGR